MTDPPTNDLDYEFDLPQEEPGGPPPEPENRARPWIIGAVLVVAIALVGYLIVRNQLRETAPIEDQAQLDVVPATPEPDALGGEPMLVALPGLDLSDELVRELVAGLSSHPRVAAWLATKGLIRNATVVVTNIAEGHTPAVHLRRLRPTGDFRVTERNDTLHVDPRSYDRYTSLATAVASVDPAGAAELYATLKPLFDEASRNLGNGDAPFDRWLERAIVRLLDTPTLENSAPVVPAKGVYAFGDPKVEALSAAQKHFLRFGPSNVRLIQTTLRSISVALGIPAAQLPTR
jgi:hypothetical protein